jgi:hypothetical protein
MSHDNEFLLHYIRRMSRNFCSKTEGSVVKSCGGLLVSLSMLLVQKNSSDLSCDAASMLRCREALFCGSGDMLRFRRR